MNYINEHIFDSPLFYSQLDVDSAKERLKKEASKKRVTFRYGGELSILSLDARNTKRNFEAAMGHGSENVILDESSLIDDVLYATVKRMLGGHKKNFLLEIGNPFYRNHFYQTWEFDKRYEKVFVDYKQALKEGRFTKDFIEEMREQPLFDVFYECKFPDEDTIDKDGYRTLVTAIDIILRDEIKLEGELKLGVDIGGGGDLNVGQLRSKKGAKVVIKNQSSDTMTNVSEIQRILKEYKELKPENVFIDDTGIGRGVTDRLHELNINVMPVTVGSKAKDDKFMNLKAELSWAMSQWIKGGGIVTDPETKKQLTWNKYKVQTDKLIKMQPKDELKKVTGKSPDYSDSLILTFMESVQPSIRFI